MIVTNPIPIWWKAILTPHQIYGVVATWLWGKAGGKAETSLPLLALHNCEMPCLGVFQLGGWAYFLPGRMDQSSARGHGWSCERWAASIASFKRHPRSKSVPCHCQLSLLEIFSWYFSVTPVTKNRFIYILTIGGCCQPTVSSPCCFQETTMTIPKHQGAAMILMKTTGSFRGSISRMIVW